MEKLYNGIILPDEWPPKEVELNSNSVIDVPYLRKKPSLINISVGRQLFVDDFLIHTTTLKRQFHSARKYEGNPVFYPQTESEIKKTLPCACPKSGGIWWDSKRKKLVMWYESGWLNEMAYAESDDGLHWNRPQIEGNDQNTLLSFLRPDSTTVFIDHDAKEPSQRYKMFLRGPRGFRPGYVMTSADGINWSIPIATSPMYDRTTIFYNPFRKKWVYSIRHLSENKRCRLYREHDDLIKGATWEPSEAVSWVRTDRLDSPDPSIGSHFEPAVYNVDAVAYESILLGLFEILYGPDNIECEKTGEPKITDLSLAYSRDGFHWHRPHREAFIASTRKDHAWDKGYVQSVGGVCIIVGDELWFYYSDFAGDRSNLHSNWEFNGMYSHGSTGLAKLRRDGFASMNAEEVPGELTTEMLQFDGKYLFVNLDSPDGELRAQLLDEEGSVIKPFSYQNCIPVKTNSTKQMISWNSHEDLSGIKGKVVKIQFSLTKGKLYSFWVSQDLLGNSNGYDAGGTLKK